MATLFSFRIPPGLPATWIVAKRNAIDAVEPAFSREVMLAPNASSAGSNELPGRLFMRFAGNFHPEWGYLAPAPSFAHRMRTVAVATAIGATAGAAVVLSLVGREPVSPVGNSGKTLVVVHSLVQPAEAATPMPIAKAPVAAPAAAPAPVAAAAAASAQAAAAAPAPVNALVSVQAPSAAMTPPASPAATQAAASTPPAASETSVPAAVAAPPSIAALSPPESDGAPSAANDPSAASDENAVEKKPGKKHHVADSGAHRDQYAKKKGSGGLAPLFRHLFSARAGNSYPN